MGESINEDNFKSAFARSVVINSKRKNNCDDDGKLVAATVVNSALLDAAGGRGIISAEEKDTERLFANEIEVIRLRKVRNIFFL